jgi:PAS domain S-box-containing protein
MQKGSSDSSGIQFEQVLKVLHEGYILVDEEANICDVNSAYCEMVGYSADELLAMSLHDVRPDMSQDYQQKFVQKAKEQGSVEFETQHRRKDGSMVDLRASAAVVEKEGRIYLAGFVRDITTEKETQKKLKESEQRWQRLVDHNPEPVLIVVDKEIVYINKAGLELIDATSKEEILGQSPFVFIIPDHQEQMKQRIAILSKGELVTPAEYQVRTLDGEKKAVRSHSVLVKYKGEDAIQSVLIDITDLKEREKKLERSEQKWQHLVEENPQPVYVTIDGEIVFINEAGAEIYGADSPEDLIGRTVFEFSHPDYVQKVEQRKHRLENDLPVDNIHEHKILPMHGDTRYVEVNSIPVKYQGKPAIQTVLFDITDRKKKEALIEASLEEKKVLLKEIHHRLKNNMAVISGLLELQAMNASGNEIHNLLRESQLRIQSMTMVHEKLYQTKSFSNLGFDEYVKQLVETIEQTVDVQTSDITVAFELKQINLDITQAIPAALIINEVVVNSFKHAFPEAHAGQIDVILSQNDATVTVDICDDGVGLPTGFDIREQPSLGMKLIQTLSRQLEGEITYKSENRVTFLLEFPHNN